ncbi:MAG TPA: HupE/UreJ family protein [Chitinophagaceae bacterium]|jgi:hypothetical protein|nr:HupE/UreJ family protein [Chitinophagaceae bacterium]
MSDFSFYYLLGWRHIISINALDHLLFLTVLAAGYSFMEWRQVLVLVTAFTIGHCITLVLSSSGTIKLAPGWVEFFIPCTILLTAASRLRLNASSGSIPIRYIMAFFFGLIHGFGFANTLRFIITENEHFGWSLFGFNIGLECGQVVFICLLLLIASFFIKFLKVKQSHWVISISILVFCLALKMAIERWPLHN